MERFEKQLLEIFPKRKTIWLTLMKTLLVSPPINTAQTFRQAVTTSLPNIRVHVLNRIFEFLFKTHPLWVGGVWPLVDHAVAIRIHEVGQENVASTKVLVKEIVEHLNYLAHLNHLSSECKNFHYSQTLVEQTVTHTYGFR